MDCSPWGREESDTTERLHFPFSLSCIGVGNGNPLQCSCLENPRDGGAWWAAVYGVAQSWTRLKRLSSSSSKEVRGAHKCPTPSVWYAFLGPRLVLGQNWTRYLAPGSLDPTFPLYSPKCSSQEAERIKWSRCAKLAKNTKRLQFE